MNLNQIIVWAIFQIILVVISIFTTLYYLRKYLNQQSAYFFKEINKVNQNLIKENQEPGRFQVIEKP